MIAMSNVKDLSQSMAFITVCFEVLRQRDYVGHAPAKVCAQIVDSQRLGPQAGEKRVARRRADRLHAIRTLEHSSARGQPVDVWRLRKPIAETPDGGLQVVHRNE